MTRKLNALIRIWEETKSSFKLNGDVLFQYSKTFVATLTAAFSFMRARTLNLQSEIKLKKLSFEIRIVLKEKNNNSRERHNVSYHSEELYSSLFPFYTFFKFSNY